MSDPARITSHAWLVAGDVRRVPTVSRFYGIVIQMFYREHGVPHFHARYAERSAVFSIEDLILREGRLPARAQRLVLQWASQHREELMSNWSRAREGKPPKQIEPLA